MNVTGELSEDGKWIWNGSEWKPHVPPEMPEETSQPEMRTTNSKLVNCRDCGNEISKRAEFCPKCGAPRKRLIKVQVKFSPTVNYRFWSYVVFLIGLGIWGICFFLLGFSSSMAGFMTITPICSGTIAVVCLLDIMYLQMKSNWQKENGIPHGNPVISIILLIIFILLPAIGYTLNFILFGILFF